MITHDLVIEARARAADAYRAYRAHPCDAHADAWIWEERRADGLEARAAGLYGRMTV